jgi:hypothetical protein
MSDRIHILCEAVAFIVVIIYFQIRVSQLNNQIKNIRNIIAEQQTVLQKHEDFIAGYLLHQNVPYAKLNTPVLSPKKATSVVETIYDTTLEIPSVADLEKEDDALSITESDLDKELSDELEELIKNKNENDASSADVSGNHES